MTVWLAVLAVRGHQDERRRDKLLLSNHLLILWPQSFSEVDVSLTTGGGGGRCCAHVICLRGASLRGKE